MKTSHYDVADHLRTSDEMEIYLEACIEVAEGDSAFIEKANGYCSCSGQATYPDSEGVDALAGVN